MGVIYQYDQQYTSPINVLDFYPVGSIYETSNSGFNPNNTWGGTWTQVSSQMISKTELYSGEYYSGSATLSASVANYDKIIVKYLDNDGVTLTKEIDNLKSSSFYTYLNAIRISTAAYFKSAQVYFNGTSATIQSNKQYSGTAVSSDGNYLRIQKIYGYTENTIYSWHRTA